MSRNSQFGWEIAEYRKTPIAGREGHHYFYLRGITSTGDAAIDLWYRANVSSADMHKLVFFNKIEEQELFAKMLEDGRMKEFYAKYVDEPAPEPYYRRWATDSSDGRFKKGDWVVDEANQIKIYHTIRVAINTKIDGTPIEDIQRQVRSSWRLNTEAKTWITVSSMSTNAPDYTAEIEHAEVTQLPDPAQPAAPTTTVPPVTQPTNNATPPPNPNPQPPTQ